MQLLNEMLLQINTFAASYKQMHQVKYMNI
jgi:hypothetical protein